ncbi:MAG: hypothetical protein R3B48_27895 [Kofleriaceae bacterium]
MPATKIAAANSRRLAAAIDALRPLDDATLQQRRAELQAQVAEPRLDEAERAQRTREHDAVEYVCAERGLTMSADPRESAETRRHGPMAIRLPETRGELRAFLEREIATAGSYVEGRRQVVMMLHSELTLASFATRRLGHEQLQILDQEVAQFRKAFAIQAMHTARAMLDDGSRAIAAALATYGLPVDTVRLTAVAEQQRDGHGDGAAADWLTLAHTDDNDARYQAKAQQRAALGAWADRLQQQQALIYHLAQEQARLLALRAAKEHSSHHQASDGPRIDLRGVNGADEPRRAAARSQAQLARLPAPMVAAPAPVAIAAATAEQRLAALGTALRDARLQLSRLWIEAERSHPILAAYRSGGSPDPAALKELGSAAPNGAPAGARGEDEQMRAALGQVMPKLANILRAKSALTGGELSPLTLPPVVELARTQMLVPPGSARAGAVHDLVDETRSGGWKQWAIAAVTLAATALSLAPTAGASVILATNLTALSLDVYSAVEAYEEYGLQSSLTNTALDQARSISAEEPSLTGLAVKLVSLGLNGAVVTKLFRQAVAIRRLTAGQELDDAVRALNRLGDQHGVPNLGDEAVADLGAARGTKAGKGTAPERARSPRESQGPHEGPAAKESLAAAPAHLEGLAQTPRTYPWNLNPDGATRTLEEALEIARQNGIAIEDDIVFRVVPGNKLPRDTYARYFRKRFVSGGRVTWNNIATAKDEVPIVLSEEVLKSDEAIVAVIAHELHEVEMLRQVLLEKGGLSDPEVHRLISPGFKGNFHDEAWDVADRMVAKMRRSRSTND